MNHDVLQFKKREILETISITGILMLDQEYPLIWEFTANVSDGTFFTNFMTNTCGSCWNNRDLIIGDNASFHVQGWSA